MREVHYTFQKYYMFYVQNHHIVVVRFFRF